MAELQGTEDKGRMILAAFEHYAVQSGEGLLKQYIIAFAWNNSWSSADVNAGLLYASKKQWVAKSPDGPIILTDEGFNEIRTCCRAS